MRLLVLLVVVRGAPEVTLPEKEDVALPVVSRDIAEGIRAGVRAARTELDRCRLRDGGPGCTCSVLRKVRFDVVLDGGTLTVTYPLVAHAGPSFTIDASGRVIDCR